MYWLSREGEAIDKKKEKKKESRIYIFDDSIFKKIKTVHSRFQQSEKARTLWQSHAIWIKTEYRQFEMHSSIFNNNNLFKRKKTWQR